MTDSQRWLLAGLALVVGLGAGLVLGIRIAEGYGREVRREPAVARLTDPVAEESERADALPEAAPPSRPESRAVTEPDPRTEREPNDRASAPPSDELRDRARRMIREAWSEGREDELSEEELERTLRMFEEAVERLPMDLGERAAREHDELDEAAEAGPALELLTRMEQGRADPRLSGVRDAPRFAELFEVRATVSTLSGPAHLRDAAEVLRDGSVLSFPAGVFRVRDLLWSTRPFPADVTVQGAGMDATLLLLGDLSTRSPVSNLAFRDCTIFTDNDYLFDLRVEPISLVMERVRCIGYDMGAGASCMIGAPACLLFARDSEFLGGYGRHPEHGQLFRVSSDDLVARFENCLVELLNVPWRSAGHLVFDRCQLRGMLLWGEAPPVAETVDLTSSQVSYRSAREVAAEGAHRDLNELFPDRRARIQE